MRLVFLCILLVCGSTTSTSAQQLKEITNSIGMKLRLILPGSFTMGSPLDEEGRNATEKQHVVTISQWYYLGVYEVTQGQFEKVMGKSRHTLLEQDLPVETVTWDDAVSFCKRLSEVQEEKSVGREYRLPTEAEWEYACRAGSTTQYFFGDTALGIGEYAWSGENAKGRTYPGGKKKGNKWGLFDTYGNVWEWCNDWYGKYPTDDLTDPKGPDFGTKRVLRGSSRLYTVHFCRSAQRASQEPTFAGSDIGFRVAMSLPVKKQEAASTK